MLHFCVELTLSAYGAVIAALTLCGDRLRCQALGRDSLDVFWSAKSVGKGGAACQRITLAGLFAR